MWDLPLELKKAWLKRLTRWQAWLQVADSKRYRAETVRQTVSHLSIEKRRAYNTTGSVKQSMTRAIAGQELILDASLGAIESRSRLRRDSKWLMKVS